MSEHYHTTYPSTSDFRYGWIAALVAFAMLMGAIGFFWLKNTAEENKLPSVQAASFTEETGHELLFNEGNAAQVFSSVEGKLPLHSTTFTGERSLNVDDGVVSVRNWDDEVISSYDLKVLLTGYEEWSLDQTAFITDDVFGVRVVSATNRERVASELFVFTVGELDPVVLGDDVQRWTGSGVEDSFMVCYEEARSFCYSSVNEESVEEPGMNWSWYAPQVGSGVYVDDSSVEEFVTYRGEQQPAAFVGGWWQNSQELDVLTTGQFTSYDDRYSRDAAIRFLYFTETHVFYGTEDGVFRYPEGKRSETEQIVIYDNPVTADEVVYDPEHGVVIQKHYAHIENSRGEVERQIVSSVFFVKDSSFHTINSENIALR